MARRENNNFRPLEICHVPGYCVNLENEEADRLANLSYRVDNNSLMRYYEAS